MRSISPRSTWRSFGGAISSGQHGWRGPWRRALCTCSRGSPYRCRRGGARPGRGARGRSRGGSRRSAPRSGTDECWQLHRRVGHPCGTSRRGALAPFDIDAQHPDTFVLHLLSLDPGVVVRVVLAQAEALRNPPFTVEQLLDTLESRGLVQSVAESFERMLSEGKARY